LLERQTMLSLVLPTEHFNKVMLFFCFMVFNAALNNISVISWRSVLFVEETGVP
jgi:hypothetical protein